VIHVVQVQVQAGQQPMHMFSFQICSTECFKQANVRYRLDPTSDQVSQTLVLVLQNVELVLRS
jgi:arylamine N-acetyltransferase